MNASPYIILRCAMSLDGYLDDASKNRLILSNAEDFDRVDAVRASCDAILVGANTIRKDNPRLLIRSEKRQTQRQKEGLSPHPIKVTITRSGNVDPSSAFFNTGETKKLLYTLDSQTDQLKKRFGKLVTVIGIGEKNIELQMILTDLYKQGIRRLLVEGGSSLHTQFLQAGLANELHIAVAPFFVGEQEAPRFVGPGKFPWNAKHPMKLDSIDQLGNVAVLKYILTQ
jgi:5-amino-6-(5-phosphoribosylamino)uracil reductase